MFFILLTASVFHSSMAVKSSISLTFPFLSLAPLLKIWNAPIFQALDSHHQYISRRQTSRTPTNWEASMVGGTWGL